MYAQETAGKHAKRVYDEIRVRAERLIDAAVGAEVRRLVTRRAPRKAAEAALVQWFISLAKWRETLEHAASERRALEHVTRLEARKNAIDASRAKRERIAAASRAMKARQIDARRKRRLQRQAAINLAPKGAD